MYSQIQRVEKEIQPGTVTSMFDNIIQEPLPVWMA